MQGDQQLFCECRRPRRNRSWSRPDRRNERRRRYCREPIADPGYRDRVYRRGNGNCCRRGSSGRAWSFGGSDSDHRSQSHQTTKLYLMNRDGSNSHSLSDKLDRDIQDPQWAPDNSGVFFRYDDQGDSKIGFFSVDGTRKTIADHLASTTGAGGSGTFSLARTGMIALTYGRPDNPGDIAISNM